MTASALAAKKEDEQRDQTTEKNSVEPKQQKTESDEQNQEITIPQPYKQHFSYGEFKLNENAPSAVNPSSGRLGSAAALFAERTPAAGPTLPDLEVNVGEAQLEPDERRVGRMLAVAALQSIEDGDMTALDYMLDDPSVERCITWARLTMAQCVAAGHFKYEDSFCI